ncbi:MAG TPA: thiamine pyrophosphate-binding protein, partial [Dehalococcoidia bacterium]|nr:thiamine pyrophosphate-binding protein [Dehalococcoidia bacterium]
MATVEGSTIVARSLKEQGVEVIFGLVGGPVIEVFGAANEYGIRNIGVRHEQAAVMMAQAYGYVGGRVGVALLASGPAVTNGLTGIHVAWDNCWPLVVLGGSSSLRQRGRGAFQEAESVAMAAPITKWAVQVDNPRRIPEYIAKAFRIALSGRPGPVYLDLPSDVLHESIDEEAARPAPRVEPAPPPQADPDAVKRAVDLLQRAQRPVLIIGKGVRWSEPYQELRELVEGLSIPFVTSPMGRGYLPDDHPLCFQSARGMALREADVALIVGARLNWMFNFGRSIGPEAKLIQIDVAPEEIGSNRPTDVGLVGDARAVLRQILNEVAQAGAPSRTAETPWLDQLRQSRAKNEATIEPLLTSDAVPMTHHRLLREVRDAIPRESILTVDGQIVLATGRQVLNT